ncbi:transcriptional regulator [Campylobacter jejuni]|nr:transcriptional regulator [Campylobacter jejuni]ECC0270414.1 transcriptional regulator [Campylobacter jejuni]EKR6962886.1 transcriptional regulator [Campylobacter jejuni]ELZ6106022.1 transcriptional regulator [Campylobacter jejuni]ELZ6323688.1 transcriptional regulator [Campylobacter jejuni]
MTKKSKRDMAYELDIDVSTLYNWRKYKPNLYRIVMLGFKFDELLENSKKTHEELLHIEQTIQDEIAKPAFKLFSIQLSLLLKSRI